MWKCPKCGRSFKKENQGHYCGKAPETVEDYIQQPARRNGKDIMVDADILERPEYHSIADWCVKTGNHA